MEKEKIERAAMELCTTEGQEEWVKDYGVSCFMDGARWRINSVWHVTFEMPERGRDFLYESARGWFGINNTAKMAREVHPENWDRFVEGFDVIRWGYIDDLLPTENAENFQRNSADFPRKFRKCRKTSSNGKETEE